MQNIIGQMKAGDGECIVEDQECEFANNWTLGL